LCCTKLPGAAAPADFTDSRRNVRLDPGSGSIAAMHDLSRWVRLGHSAMSAPVSALPESGHRQPGRGTFYRVGLHQYETR